VVGGLGLATLVATAGPALALTSQTISFTGPASTALNAGPVAISATASSGLTVAFTSATTGVCTVAGTSVTLVSVGTCTINANQAGNGTFSAAPQVAQSFPVTIGSQTISFTGPATSQLNASPVTVAATASSGLSVAFTSATAPVCTVAGTSVTLVAVGTCTIDANQAGTSNYTAATQVVQSFTVTLNAQTITFAQPASVQLTAATDTIAATATSGLTVAFTSSTTGVCTVSGTTVSLVATGTCTINADQAGNGTFAVAPTVARSFQVTGSTAQTISFTGPSATPQLTGTVAVSATSTSGLTVGFTSVTTGVCTVSGTTVTLLTAGSCIIHADQAGNGTFASAPTVSQTFAVTLTAQTISFTGPASTAMSAGPVTVSATASSGLTVAFTSATTGICTTTTGGTVTLLGVGTCTINANQAGNVSYSAATQVPQSFAVTIGSQTIAFTGPGSTLLSAGTVGVTATASSGLTVAFTSATTPVCTVSGTTVTLVALGTCTINANQAGTANWTAAPQVAQSFSVTAAVSSGGGTPAPTVPATPVRLSGTDRFGTAIAASAVEFPAAGTAGAVVLARSDDYPDALVGAALASAKNAPLLFANGGLLTAATQAEIQRVLPAGGTVYLLGGTAAIPATVATSLTSLGFVPVRYAGTDRFGTALAVADALNDPSTVLLATGINFPDALAAGPAAAHIHGVVLLTNGSSLTPAVTAYLAAHPGTVYAIGGPAVAADPSATPLSGADRYATAAAVASTLFTTPANVGVASGTAFPDALTGGAFQAHFGGPIVLTDPHILPTSTSAYLTAVDSSIVTTNIFGGASALSATVQTAVGTALGL
jgi:putative cell wall-binding protein